ncbi:PREDICTED: ADP-ribosylation factor-like protein 13B [Nanorana parkeri]|uniref:ADP-ribosylation factor-like protein 13B n=1 Tax=Nanorana parkeri TaxID=125878 RepID=UPI0008548D71|nr:PREDICTED: ADP-ribosylation factor-like protein 13B [Nanorana parkeri]
MDGAEWPAGAHFKHWKMFHLFSHCWHCIQKKHEPVRNVTILFMGLENSGKSSVIRVIKRVPPKALTSPSSDPLKTQLRLDHFNLTLLELPSGQKARASWRLYYPQAHAFVFLVDSCDRGRLQEVASVLQCILKHPAVSGKPLLILANKQERAFALLPSEIIELLSLEKLVNENKTICRIEPCSATTDLRSHYEWTILKGLRWILKSVTFSYSSLNTCVLQESAEQKESIHHRTAVMPRNVSDLPKWKVTDEEITGLVEYKPFPCGKERALKPIQNILTQTGYSLQRTNKKKRKKVKVLETSSPQILNADGSKVRDKKAEPRASPAKESRHHYMDPRTVVIPASQSDNQATREGSKRRKKRRPPPPPKQQIKSLDGVRSTGDMGQTFDLYRKAMQALKLKQETQRKVNP